VGNFLTSRETVTFSRILLRGVGQSVAQNLRV